MMPPLRMQSTFSMSEGWMTTLQYEPRGRQAQAAIEFDVRATKPFGLAMVEVGRVCSVEYRVYRMLGTLCKSRTLKTRLLESALI